MTRRAARLTAALLITAGLAACSGGGTGNRQQTAAQPERESSFWDLFSNRRNSNDAVAVNKYLWNASLEVLNFLPVQTIDPFTGVIVTGYGTPRVAAVPIAPRFRSPIRRWMRAGLRCRCKARVAARLRPTPCALSKTRS